jgi:hypothetical protein
LGCETNAYIRLINGEAKFFNEYYRSGKISPAIKQFLRDGLIFHVYSPNDIPIERFDVFANLVVWVTSTDNNINEVYIKSCKIISDYFVDGQVTIDENKCINLQEEKYENLVLFRGYTDLLPRNIIDNELKRINYLPSSIANKTITVELSVEYTKDDNITKTIIVTDFILKIYKSFSFWDKLMSV